MRINLFFILLILVVFFSCDDQGGPSYGCTDIDACNYDSNAELEDGTCEYVTSDDPQIGEYCYCTGESEPQIVDCDGVCGGDNATAILDVCGNCLENYLYTYSDVLTKMISLGCTSCHTGTSNGGLDLSTYSGIMSQITNSGGVIDTACSTYLSSVILQKIDGGSMSQNADDELIGMLATWIYEGAPE